MMGGKISEKNPSSIMEATLSIKANWFEKRMMKLAKVTQIGCIPTGLSAGCEVMEESVTTMLHCGLFGSSPSSCLHCFCVRRQCCKRLRAAFRSRSAVQLWVLLQGSVAVASQQLLFGWWDFPRWGSWHEMCTVQQPSAFPPIQNGISPPSYFILYFSAFAHWKNKTVSLQ